MLITQKCIELYGDPGVHLKEPNPAWVRDNIVGCGWNGKAELPAMPGVPNRFYFAVHRKVEPVMRAAFQAAKDACPEYTIGTAGCFVFRHQRHDVTKPLSLHSWGIAVDIDAGLNSGHDFNGLPQPMPWSVNWNIRWPHGLPRAFVEAFEAHGFDWGGRWHGYVDGMHMQVKAP